MKTIRIGAGAGFSDDRIEPAVELAERGNLDYLIFECLAERTIALAQLDRLNDPTAGYNEWLEDRMDAVLDIAASKQIRIITNMGAASPVAAAELVARIAARKGLEHLRIVAVTGDDVLAAVKSQDLPLLEREGSLSLLADRIVSANAYLGVGALLEALSAGADVIIAGRIADPSLFLAPLVHEFGWALDDWELLGAGTAAGHLLECGAQVTGGYYVDPPKKSVPDLGRLGLPIAEVSEDGAIVITKTPNTGGEVTPATVVEQLFYEVHNPAAYETPDVVADFSGAQLEQVGPDRVAVTGITGHPRPRDLKVSVGYIDSYIGEGQISYAGPGAVARAKLAIEIVRERLAVTAVPIIELRTDIIGLNSVNLLNRAGSEEVLDEARVRVVARTADLRQARRVGHEVTSLWLNGPAGGGGATRDAKVDIGIASVFVPRDVVNIGVNVIEATV